MKHCTHSDTNLTPIQAGAAIALGFGLSFSAVAAEFNIHRSTIHNWMKTPAFAEAAQSCRAEFEKQFRTQLAMLTRRALETLQEILTDPEASPSVRLKAALAVLKQDWKLPHSTEFDTIAAQPDSLRNEMPPEPEPQPVRSQKIGRNDPCPCGSNLKYKRCCGNPLKPVDTFRHTDSNEINNVRNEMPGGESVK